MGLVMDIWDFLSSAWSILACPIGFYAGLWCANMDYDEYETPQEMVDRAVADKARRQ